MAGAWGKQDKRRKLETEGKGRDVIQINMKTLQLILTISLFLFSLVPLYFFTISSLWLLF